MLQKKSKIVHGIKYNGTEKISYSYDSLMRRAKTTINTTNPFVTTYGYKDISLDKTTTLLNSISYSNGKAFIYTYDANGNILTIKDQNNTLLANYTYDALNQLTREDNAQLNKTITYTYDNGGNILSVKEYAFTNGELGSVVNEKTYTYGNSEWKDLLTNYNGVAISYDTIGNPLNWVNGEVFTWSGGRQLTGITKGNTNISYTYNDDGIRTSKTVNGTRTDYYLNGTAVIMQKTGDNCIWFTYDENDLVTGFRCNGNEYYYIKNSQSDIIGIIDASGTSVANYTYDSWGKHIAITDGNGNDVSGNSSHIANVNPFRYRGYYFDAETGLYYLNSRYYDAKVGRFLNADGYTFSGIGIIGFNIFSYCSNSVIILCDTEGNRPISSMSIQKEKMYDRVKACQWQNKVVLEKYNPAPIGYYSKGKIYLVEDEKDIKVTFSGDIIAIDKRDLKGDASQVIIKKSYKITDDNDKIDILNALNDFENRNPSNWNRTIESMLFEWNFHNDCYNISNFIPFATSIYNSSKDVNFDNKEEGYNIWDYFVNRVID